MKKVTKKMIKECYESEENITFCSFDSSHEFRQDIEAQVIAKCREVEYENPLGSKKKHMEAVYNFFNCIEAR